MHTVAIGEDADALLLQQMAEATGGRFRNLVEDAGPATLRVPLADRDRGYRSDDHPA